MTVLAFHGAALRQALVEDSSGLSQLLSRTRAAIQVAAAVPDAILPVPEFADDYPPPDNSATLCPGAIPALSSDDPFRACPGPHDETIVCPTGFWGLRRTIERHAYQDTVAAAIDGAFVMNSLPTRQLDTIQPGPLVFAATDQVNGFDPEALSTLQAALAPGGDLTYVADWKHWKEAVKAAPAPALLVVLSHTVYNKKMRAYGLEIGADSLALSFAQCVPASPSLVMLLGCKTALTGELSYERFAAAWRLATKRDGKANVVVIATITDVLGRHASPIAARLVAEIRLRCHDYPRGTGEVILSLRRRLVAEGMLPVLAVTAFGDADWLVKT